MDPVVAGTFIRSVEQHAELGSTNDRAQELDPSIARPALVVADRQTAGRGRGANTWWSAAGSLTFSVALDRDSLPVPDARRSLVALATGLAVRTAVSRLAPAVDVRLKWPNDVLVGDRKLCGILVEEADGRTVIGIGVNVGNSFREAPAEIRETGTSLVDLLPTPVDRLELLREVLLSLEAELALLGSTDEADRIDARWAPYCALAGHGISVLVHDRVIEGRCEGIDESGALLVRTSDGRVERLLSGVVSSAG